MEDYIFESVSENTFGELKFQNEDLSTSWNLSEDLKNTHEIRENLRRIGFLESELEKRDKVIEQLREQINNFEVGSNMFINSAKDTGKNCDMQLETSNFSLNEMNISEKFQSNEVLKTNLNNKLAQNDAAVSVYHDVQLVEFPTVSEWYVEDNNTQMKTSKFIDDNGVSKSVQGRDKLEPLRISHRQSKSKHRDISKKSKITFYDCSYCTKKFSNKYYLKFHNEIHTNTKPYTCNVCNTAFRQRPHLLKHISCCHLLDNSVSMKDEGMDEWYNAYLCYFCSNIMTTREEYRNHISKIHSNLLKRNE